MLNQIVLVGRISKEVEKLNDKHYTMQIGVPRPFKNSEGEYETDFIDVIMTGHVGENTLEYTKKGDIVGVKGRLQSGANKVLEVMAEKITFLSSNNSNN